MGLCEDNLYELNFTKVHGVDPANLIQLSKKDDGVLELWHCPLGHLHLKSVRALQSMVNHMNLGNFIYIVFSLVCEACIEGKQHKIIFTNKGGSQVTKPLEIVHLGMCSPIRHPWAVQDVFSPSLMIFQGRYRCTY